MDWRIAEGTRRCNVDLGRQRATKADVRPISQ